MTHTDSLRREWPTAVTLLLILTITRSGIVRTHFGDALTLPDMSWAIFWLMGALTTRFLWPVLLMAASVGADAWAVQHGVSADCFTLAYAALPLAYGALWASGRRCAGCKSMQSAQQIAGVALSLMIGVTTCFAISNLGFYLASGYFTGVSLATFTRAVLRYWPAYMMHTTLAALTGLLLARGLRMLRTSRDATHTA